MKITLKYNKLDSYLLGTKENYRNKEIDNYPKNNTTKTNNPMKIMKRYGISPILRFTYRFNFEKRLKNILT